MKKLLNLNYLKFLHVSVIIFDSKIPPKWHLCTFIHLLSRP